MKKVYEWICLRWRMVIQPSLLKGMNKVGTVKKFALDVLMAIAIILAILMHFKDALPGDLQTYLIKMGQLNISVIYGWAVGRLFIGKVDWDEKEYTPKIRARLYLWGIIIISFALGG